VVFFSFNDFSSTIAALVEPVRIRFVCPFGTKLAATNGFVFDVCIVNSHYIRSANCQNIFHILIDQVFQQISRIEQAEILCHLR
jgi:hypothetical protein